MRQARVLLSPDRMRGPILGESIAVIPEGGGEAAFDRFATALEDCDTDVVDDRRYTGRPLAFPALGDQSIAVRYQIEPEGPEVRSVQEVVYVRLRDVVMAVSVLDIGTAPDEYGDLLETWAPEAVDKAARFLGSR
jgi:hypothetical protein